LPELTTVPKRKISSLLKKEQMNERQERKGKKCWQEDGEGNHFFLKDNWQYLSKAFDLLILPLRIYHKAIRKSRCKNSSRNVHCNIIYNCGKDGINLNVPS
jgi:hypothetical protein